jgi:hypothetical protein
VGRRSRKSQEKMLRHHIQVGRWQPGEVHSSELTRHETPCRTTLSQSIRTVGKKYAMNLRIAKEKNCDLLILSGKSFNSVVSARGILPQTASRTILTPPVRTRTG